MDAPASAFVIESGRPMIPTENVLASTTPRFHLWHQWTRWSAPTTVPYRMPRADGEFFTFTRDEQYRTCVKCGAEEMREVGGTS